MSTMSFFGFGMVSLKIARVCGVIARSHSSSSASSHT
jgi:hypothetical protein